MRGRKFNPMTASSQLCSFVELRHLPVFLGCALLHARTWREKGGALLDTSARTVLCHMQLFPGMCYIQVQWFYTFRLRVLDSRLLVLDSRLCHNPVTQASDWVRYQRFSFSMSGNPCPPAAVVIEPWSVVKFTGRAMMFPCCG